MECVECGKTDCKWPGACYGRCWECGGPSRPIRLPMADGSQFTHDDGRPVMDGVCSDACFNARHERGVADGSIVAFSDMTIEQVNATLNQIGLKLEGVGPVVPS